MNRIKEVLEEKGIKQIWLAEQLGKSYNTVNSYVQNRRQPSIDNLYSIADILNVEAKDLLQPKEVAIKIVTDKGTFMEMYDINNIADIKQDILQFKIHGHKKQSTMSEWRRY